MKNKKRSIILLSLSSIGMIASIVLYILSYKKTDYGEWGVDYSFNFDYVITFIIFFIVFILGLYELISIIKNNSYKDYTPLAVSLILALGAAYPYSVFFKELSKSGFEYVEYQIYLYIGTLSLIALILCLIYFHIKKK